MTQTRDPYAVDPSTATAPRRAFSPFSLLLLAGAVLMLAVVGWGIYQNSLSQPEEGPAPDFSLPLLDDSGTFTLSEQRGKVVVINFWGSWCGPCRLEAPMLQRAYELYQPLGVEFVGIAVKDIKSDSLAYIEEFGITYPNVMDVRGNMEDRYRTQGVPETFIVDREGNIRHFFLAQPRETDFYAAIEEALNS